MKTSNKIFFGLLAALALNVLTGMVLLRNSLAPGGIGYGQTIIEGKGALKKVTLAATDFKEIEIEGNFRVSLIQGEEFVEIEVEENIANLIEVKVEHKKLYFDAKEGYTLMPSKGIDIKIGFKDLRAIHAYGLSNISATQSLTFDKIELRIHGAGRIQFPLNAKQLKVRLNGSSRSYLSGEVEKMEVGIAGAGGLEADSLLVKKANIGISGAGYANVNVINQLDASTVGSGRVRYLGDPKVNRRTAGAGRIYKK